MFKIILSIDISLKQCSITLLINKKYYNISVISKKKHNNNILFIISNILNFKKISIKKINLIIFTKGPGSLTGIKICFCIIKSFYFIYKIPYLGISTLKIIAEQIWRKFKKKKIIIYINYKSKIFFFAKYIKKKKKWIGKKTEKIIKKKKIKIKLLKKKWLIVTNTIKKIIIKKKKNIKKIFLYPNSQDLISIFLNNKKINFKKKINLNFLFKI